MRLAEDHGIGERWTAGQPLSQKVNPDAMASVYAASYSIGDSVLDANCLSPTSPRIAFLGVWEAAACTNGAAGRPKAVGGALMPLTASYRNILL